MLQRNKLSGLESEAVLLRHQKSMGVEVQGSQEGSKGTKEMSVSCLAFPIVTSSVPTANAQPESESLLPKS